MRREDILSLTRAQPFQPFVVLLTNGERFEIRHPDMLLVTPEAVHIAIPPPMILANDIGSVRIVSLFQLVKTEYLPSPSTFSNGVVG